MISIITSAYNASSTIAKTIKSVQQQSFTDWELIIVNDCSTDNTVEIVNSFLEDKRIRLIQHEVNKGAGLARRTGISNIKGEYTMFLDSDDYLKKNCLKRLYNAAKEYNVDVVSPGYIIVDSNFKTIQKRIPTKLVYTGKDKFKPNKEDTKRFMNPMLIKSSLWDNVEYSSRRFIEDAPTLIQILYYANSVLTLDYAGYYYVQNPKGLVHSASTLKYDIFTTLSLKDSLIFLNSKGCNLSYDKFLNAYAKLLDLEIEEEEYSKYKSELDELYNFYKTL